MNCIYTLQGTGNMVPSGQRSVVVNWVHSDSSAVELIKISLNWPSLTVEGLTATLTTLILRKTPCNHHNKKKNPYYSSGSSWPRSCRNLCNANWWWLYSVRMKGYPSRSEPLEWTVRRVQHPWGSQSDSLQKGTQEANSSAKVELEIISSHLYQLRLCSRKTWQAWCLRRWCCSANCKIPRSNLRIQNRRRCPLRKLPSAKKGISILWISLDAY